MKRIKREGTIPEAQMSTSLSQARAHYKRNLLIRGITENLISFVLFLRATNPRIQSKLRYSADSMRKQIEMHEKKAKCYNKIKS